MLSLVNTVTHVQNIFLNNQNIHRENRKELKLCHYLKERT